MGDKKEKKENQTSIGVVIKILFCFHLHNVFPNTRFPSFAWNVIFICNLYLNKTKKMVINFSSTEIYWYLKNNECKPKKIKRNIRKDELSAL